MLIVPHVLDVCCVDDDDDKTDAAAVHPWPALAVVLFPVQQGVLLYETRASACSCCRTAVRRAVEDSVHRVGPRLGIWILLVVVGGIAGERGEGVGRGMSRCWMYAGCMLDGGR